MIEPFPKLQGRGDFIQWAWEKRSNWPSDWDDKVFLGRALDLVGRAKFGAEWTGRDPEGMPNIKALPSEWADAEDHIRGGILEQAWLDAVAGREEHRRLARASYERWHEATELLAHALRGPGLAAYGRGKKSTHFLPIERQSFNLDDMRPLFKNLTLRIRTSYMDMTECWVFVDAAALAGIIAATGAPAEATATDNTASQNNSGPARSGAEITAEDDCATWLWGGYISKSQKPTHTKKELRSLAANQEFWPRMRNSVRAFDRSWAAAIAKGGGLHDDWKRGSAAK